MSQGPLAGVKVVEFGAIGPVPFCAMMLADMGADVVQLARKSAPGDLRFEGVNRGRQIIELDLKDPDGKATAEKLIAQADILLEGNRPGVAERLGFGPAQCQALNEKLVFGRMTGWGQSGPLAHTAGHDINYIALTGALHAIGPLAHPVPPLNLVGDYGGGAMYLAFGVVCALLESRRSGKGQVVDAAMVDGAASLMSVFYGLLQDKAWRDERAANLLDGGAPWYGTYETADDRHVAVGALEEKFWQALLHGLGILETDLPPRRNRAGWEAIRTTLAAAFKSKTRDEWAAIFELTDACVTPVLTLAEAPAHEHNVARENFITLDGTTQPAPAPRFSRTPGAAKSSMPASETEILGRWGCLLGHQAKLPA
jgi:alpha-methylacyl-CoA racemase